MHFSPYKFGIARDKTRLRREGRHAGDGFRRHLAGWCLFFLEVSFDAKGKGTSSVAKLRLAPSLRHRTTISRHRSLAPDKPARLARTAIQRTPEGEGPPVASPRKYLAAGPEAPRCARMGAASCFETARHAPADLNESPAIAGRSSADDRAL
jgi:hypothetical protein